MIMISVIVITRNEEKNISRTLRSLKDRRITEIIVSDSNSNDNTSRVVELEAQKDKRIKFKSYHSAPFTAARGRNEGAKLASLDSEYFLFIDGDMEMNTSFIDASLLKFNQDKEIAALSGQMHNYYYNDKMELKKQDLNVYKISENKPGGAMIVRAHIYRQANGYNSNLIVNEESELIYRIKKAGYFFKRIDYLMIIHHTEEPTSNTRFKERMLDRKITGLSHNVVAAIDNPGYFKVLLKENYFTFLTLASGIILISTMITGGLLIGALQFLATFTIIAARNKSLRIPFNYMVYSIGLIAGLLKISSGNIKRRFLT